MPVQRTLHAAGNYRDLHPLAEHPAVDAIEADVWVVRGRVVAHHERPLGRVPLMLSERGLRPPIPNPVSLEELLAAVEGYCGLILDVRSWFGDPAPDLYRGLAPQVSRAHLAVTCESWKVGDRLRAWLEDIPVSYSIQAERQLRRYVDRRIDGDLDGSPIAVRHTLLHHPAEVEALHAHTPHIAAWTVDDVERALQLVEWGVDEVVSNNLDVLNAI